MKINIKPSKISTSFKMEKIYPELENIRITPTSKEQVFKSEKYGFNEIIVEAINIKLQDKTVTPTLQEQTINADEGYNALSKVYIEAIRTENLDIIPLEVKQIKTGLFRTVNIEPIQTEEITTDLDFSSSDAIELTAQEGAYIKKATINKDANLTPENIKAGVSIAGISGDVADTSDADATSNDIALGKTAYVNNQKVTGVMEVNDNNALVGTTISAGSSNSSGLNVIIKKIPDDLIISGTDIRNMFSYCRGLTEINLDTSNVEITVQTFSYCTGLTKLSQLEASKFKATQNMFLSCTNLQEFGGLLNLGKGFDKTESYSAYHTLNLSSSTKLIHESLMNIINNLYDLNLTYDVSNGGTLYTQQLKIGSTNLAKLTDEEKAIATSKGWSLA